MNLVYEEGGDIKIATVQSATGSGDSESWQATSLTGKKIKKVAVCGGSGSFLISEALSLGADAFITADLKYHQFQEPENKMLLVDAGHFETEYHTLQIFYELLNKKFPTFAIYFSKVSTNPVNYL